MPEELEEAKESLQPNALCVPGWDPGPETLKRLLKQLTRLKFE